MDGVATTPQRIVDRLAQKTQAGDILLLHDGIEPNHHRDPSVTIAALRPLVQKLRQRRVEPVRLDDLIGVQAYAPTSEPRD
jgi:peptidoglycan/xylan/chitin deacetylase (PgdA/CDA1 family)